MNAITTNTDDSEDVSDFLQRIRELGDQRDREDEERNQKLEEEILQGRKEREARRAERARSLSPSKSHAGTPHSVNTSMHEASISPGTVQQRSPTSQQRAGSSSLASGSMATSLSHEQDLLDQGIATLRPVPLGASETSDSTAATPARSNTLSWQQRPSSRGSAAGRSRPLSVQASENNAARSPRASVEPLPANDTFFSRTNIKQSLNEKDPTFFKQTEDRGVRSAAYRKTQSDEASTISTAARSLKLPGMSTNKWPEPENASSPAGSVRSSSPPMERSVRASPSSVQKHSSSASNPTTPPINSPMPTLDNQRLDPPSSSSNASQRGGLDDTGRALAMSPSQGRMSPERLGRPVSPTKGLGGFVQSAMLKRSDSVTKRWSAHAGPGLSRGNSLASNHSGHDGAFSTVGALGLSKELQAGQSRETSPVASSRPGSGHSNLTITQAMEHQEKPQGSAHALAATDTPPDNVFAKPAPQRRREDRSVPELQSVGEEEKRSPPTSPSKRWSPSKSSWLENAINKPDSPKPKAPPPQQPTWLSELNKAKQQRGSIDTAKLKDFKEVETTSLLRSPPMGSLSKSSSVGGFPAAIGTGRSLRPRDDSPNAMSRDSTLNDLTSTEELEPGPRPRASIPGKVTTSSEYPVAHPDLIQNGDALSPTSKPTLEKVNAKTPLSVKSKPATPPKKDLVGSLRPGKVPSARETNEEPEFKNFFGKLKRTQTQNYKAPDELKDNIVRGKAGLNVTGGPRQAERKDEFKESILKKKEGMKAGLPSASTTIRNTSRLSPGPNTSLPEALAKRQGLTRSGSNLNTTMNGSKPSDVSASNSSKGREFESTYTPSKHSFSEPEKVQGEQIVNDTLGAKFSTTLAGVILRGPSPTVGGNDAGPARAPDANTSVHPSLKDNSQPISDGVTQLTHMTKGRARGPKRRLPANIADSRMPIETPQLQRDIPDRTNNHDYSREVHDKESPSKASEVQPLSNISNNYRRVSQPSSSRKPSAGMGVSEDVKQQSQRLPPAKQKPTMNSERPKPRKPSTSTVQSSPTFQDIQNPAQELSSTAQITEPKLLPIEKATPVTVVKEVTNILQNPLATQEVAVNSPIKRPTFVDELMSPEHTPSTTSTAVEPIGLGIKTANTKSEAPNPLIRNLPVSPAASPKMPKSPPIPAKKSTSITSRVPSTSLATQQPPWKLKSSFSPNSEASRVLTDFFGSSPVCNVKFNIHTQSIISNRSSYDTSDKIKTLRKQIFQVAADGKLLPIPSHQEHILFEEHLYLCTHVFGNSSGNRTTEVYLWCGDAVPTSAAEDAQLFCRKVARDNNSKLIILKQGKETANFFQALGVVITRRSSSARASSPSSSGSVYMLRGRRHVGQVAFDEVDYTPSSLCKGFPYIIYGIGGKVFVWRGAGSCADELGCAKLIGMDISLTGEIEEVQDGQEPTSFWEVFPGGQQGLPDADAERHWQLKASCEKYATRLFGVEIESSRPKSSSSFLWGRRGSAPINEDEGTMTAMINEIVPFAQSDLDSNEGIHVLDAFFEVHVLVPSNSKALLPTFRAACEFAQEYGILVASAEDRPFVPISRVVLGRSVPDGVKRAFRKWIDTPYEKMESVILPLNESLRATQPS